MRPIARVGDRVWCPLCGHGVILSGSPIEFLDGRPVARLGDMTSFGPIITGSPYLFLDGRPIARMGDIVQCLCISPHPGLIVEGSPSSFI
jgi:uncharacterized Zn-binding protein involved in type VI secretion